MVSTDVTTVSRQRNVGDFHSKYRGRTVVVCNPICRARGTEGIVEGDILHVVGPYQERASSGAPSHIIVSGEKVSEPTPRGTN